MLKMKRRTIPRLKNSPQPVSPTTNSGPTLGSGARRLASMRGVARQSGLLPVTGTLRSSASCTPSQNVLSSDIFNYVVNRSTAVTNLMKRLLCKSAWWPLRDVLVVEHVVQVVVGLAEVDLVRVEVRNHAADAPDDVGPQDPANEHSDLGKHGERA